MSANRPEDTLLARSARSLEGLYTVAIGLAVTVAITSIVDPAARPNPILIALLPQLAALLVTLLPFYHGAMRHLDRWYIQEGGANVRSGGLLADSLMLFVQACVLVTMAVLLSRPFAFTAGLVGLLSFDAVWGGATYLAFAKEKHVGAELRWVAINVVTVPILIAILLFADVASLPGRLLVTGVAVARSSVDYALSWSFYFPEGRDHAVSEANSMS